MNATRLTASALAVFGAASAVPIALAQLDFAGLFNAFNVDSGDTPTAVLVLAGIGGVLTLVVAALAIAGAVLGLVGSAAARAVLAGAALGGLVAVTPLWPLWLPSGLAIGAAAVLLGRADGTPRPRLSVG
jgi:hypothetical protein